MAEPLSYTFQPPLYGLGSGILVRSDGAYVPLDLGNMDYQAFLAWVAEGNPAPEGWTGPTNVVPVESP